MNNFAESRNNLEEIIKDMGIGDLGSKHTLEQLYTCDHNLFTNYVMNIIIMLGKTNRYKINKLMFFAVLLKTTVFKEFSELVDPIAIQNEDARLDVYFKVICKRSNILNYTDIKNRILSTLLASFYLPRTNSKFAIESLTVSLKTSFKKNSVDSASVLYNNNLVNTVKSYQNLSKKLTECKPETFIATNSERIDCKVNPNLDMIMRSIIELQTVIMETNNSMQIQAAPFITIVDRR